MDTLITKLPGTIDLPGLNKLGESSFTIEPTNTDVVVVEMSSLSSLIKINVTITAGNGYFTDSAGTANLGKKTEISTVSGSLKVYIKPTEVNNITVSFTKAGIVTFVTSVKNLAGTSLQVLKVDTSSLAYFENLTFLNLSSMLVGNIGAIGKLQSLARIVIINAKGGKANVFGSFFDFISKRVKTQITHLHLQGINVDVNLNDLSGIVVNVGFNILNVKSLTGSVESISTVQSTSVILNQSGTVTGDISKLNDKVKSFTGASGHSYTWSAVSSSRTEMLLIINNPNMSNIDKYLNDIAPLAVPAIASNLLSIQIKGTRTSASDAAVSTLQGKGITVTISA
ncbi:hypothetical protein [Sphingobacterium multivorum]|uniref:hypothetical protein n=1 Tax=Sphingobacterium multivorum TaxID=28454 RepID=UPI003DA294DB